MPGSDAAREKKELKKTEIDSISSKSDIMETPLFILKKRILLITFFVRYLFVGAEYSVILPTVLLYLESLNASQVFMGIVVAAYPLAAMISLPFFGYLYDKTKRTKELLIVLNAFQIAGNIIYSLPFSKWFPVAGRFLAGLGDGFITLVVGEVTYIYPQSYRIGILSLLELGRVIGIFYLFPFLVYISRIKTLGAPFHTGVSLWVFLYFIVFKFIALG